MWGLSSPTQGSNPGSPTVEAQESLNQWTAGRSPILLFVMNVIMLFFVHNQSFLSCLFQNYLSGFQHFLLWCIWVCIGLHWSCPSTFEFLQFVNHSPFSLGWLAIIPLTVFCSLLSLSLSPLFGVLLLLFITYLNCAPFLWGSLHSFHPFFLCVLQNV